MSRSLRDGDLPLRLAAGHRELSYAEYLPYGWYSADSASELLEYAEASKIALSTAFASLEDESLCKQESDGVDRLVCNWRWKGMFPFPYTTGDELIVRNESQARALSAALRSTCDLIMRAARDILTDEAVRDEIANTAYPINKGKGAPFWVPGTSLEGASPLTALTLGATSFDEVEQRCYDVGARMPCCITLYTRIQASRKDREILRADRSGAPVATGTMGRLPKVRKVQGVPFVINLPLAEIGAAILAAARAADLGILPSLEEAQMAAERYPRDRLFAEDVSNFDDSVGVELWSLVVDLLAIPMAWLLVEVGVLTDVEALLAESVLEKVATLAILIPPLRFDEVGRLLDRAGAVPSGIRLTSVLGSVINRARIQHNLDRVKASGAMVMAFGDDTLIGFERDRDMTAYRETLAEFSDRTGFVTTVADDAAFLMRRMPDGYGYVSRMVLSTLQKEHTHEPRSMPIAALGIAARRTILGAHPMADLYTRMCVEGTMGPRVQAAHALAASQNYNVAALAGPVFHEVGMAGSASRAHSGEDVLSTLEDVFGEGFWQNASTLTAELSRSIRDRLAVVRPSVRSLKADAAVAFNLTRGEPDLRQIGRALDAWRY